MWCKSFQLIVIQLIFIIYLIEISYGHKYKTYNFDDYPEDRDTTISLGSTSSKDSAIILNASKKVIPKEGKYKLTVKTGNNQLGIIGTLQTFNLRGNIGSDCKDKLQIWKKNSFGNVLIYSDCSAKKFPKPLVLVPPFEESFTFELEIGDSSWRFSKLEITLSSYRSCPLKSFANSKEFFCKDGRCINEHLECDFRQNCGDNSDEFDCRDGLSGWAITFIVLSSIIFFISIVICCRICRRRRRTETCHNVRTYGTHEAPPAHYSYPPNTYPIQPQQNPMYQAGIQNPGFYPQPPPGAADPNYFQQPPPPPYYNNPETKTNQY